MYQLTEDELSNLQTAGNYKTLDVAIFALCVGVLITVLATLSTVDISNAKVFSTFTALAFASGIGMVFFGIRAFLAWRAANKHLDAVKRSDAHS